MSQAMTFVAAELFSRDAEISDSAMRKDKTGHVRAHLVQCVFRVAATRAEV